MNPDRPLQSARPLIILAAMPAPALQHGPYVTPNLNSKTHLVCEVRGIVRIVGLSDAPIPWPVGEQDGRQELVVCRGLARALQTEAPEAVAAAWGVPVATVRGWQAVAEQPTSTVAGSRPSHWWSPAEDGALLAAGDITAFAKKHGRTTAACRYHRWLLRCKLAKAADRMRKPARKKRRQ